MHAARQGHAYGTQVRSPFESEPERERKPKGSLLGAGTAVLRVVMHVTTHTDTRQGSALARAAPGAAYALGIDVTKSDVTLRH